MAHLLIWSPRASDDLAEIAAYIAQDSKRYSATVIRNIIRKVNKLTEFPMIGRVVPEYDDPSIREIFAYSYRIIYEVDSTSVSVAAIIHGKRDVDTALRP